MQLLPLPSSQISILLQLQAFYETHHHHLRNLKQVLVQLQLKDYFILE